MVVEGREAEEGVLRDEEQRWTVYGWLAPGAGECMVWTDDVCVLRKPICEETRGSVVSKWHRETWGAGERFVG